MRFLRIFIVFIAILFFGGFFYISSETDIQQFIIEFLQNASSHYAWIILIIFGITVMSTLTGLPVLYLTVAMGFFLPFLPSLAISWFINLISILVTYRLVRGVYAERFREKYGKKKVIQKINKRIKKYGFWTVAISRSIYIIPTNIINLSFPLSKISPKQYLFGTMIGLLPECLINVTTGYLLKNGVLLLTSPEKNLLKVAFVIMALLLLTIGFIIFRYRRKKSKIDKIKKIIPLLGDD